MPVFKIFMLMSAKLRYAHRDALMRDVDADATILPPPPRPRAGDARARPRSPGLSAILLTRHESRVSYFLRAE